MRKPMHHDLQPIGRWQYTGIAPMSVIVKWCEAKLPKHMWRYDWDTIHFYDGKAHTLFLLRWS
jgi:hypothetical protein